VEARLAQPGRPADVLDVDQTTTALDDVLRAGTVRSVFQPIISLDTCTVVAYEALARGPEGPLQSPDALFAAARAEGRLAELDAACRTAAFRSAVEQRLLDPLTVFVNVEPEVLDAAPLEDLLAIADAAPRELRVVMEITERALAARPAELLRTVERVRELGWGVALDDVGADAMSLAFMPLLRPDVIKLDLRLVQERPGPAIAEIMNAVNAHAERSGAVVLAEGIETEQHLVVAQALGATLGQGWFFGRPAPGISPAFPVGELVLPALRAVSAPAASSPFASLPASTVLRQAPKGLLIELSKQLEREAVKLGDTCLVASTFQEAKHFTPSTERRYAELAEATAFVCALGEGLPDEPLPGVRGAQLHPDDPVRGEWDVVVLSPHFSAALLARDLGDDGPDVDRMFEFALTYHRYTVVRAAEALMSRVVPQPSAPPVTRSHPSATTAPRGTPPQLSSVSPISQELLRRALEATASGVAISDMTLPDSPLVYVNPAFERLSGFRADEVLGRNCRFLQGPATDPASVDRIRAAIAEGREARETLLNHRGVDRSPWWNAVHLSPVSGTDGVVRHYIGVQEDVSAQVTAEAALIGERDRAQSYLAQIEQLAFTDPLTGLQNRRWLEQQVEVALQESRATGSALAVLFLDLDGFKAVNDQLGHAAGDELLGITAQRLSSRLRQGDLLCRLGGDEFLVALPGLSEHIGQLEAHALGQSLVELVSEPVVLRGREVSVGASIGMSVYPDDGETFETLLHAADTRMYLRKQSVRS
jgi:diguanylate cyclase (GGDEF)-like protein/PAS domain S-box-containing protein